MKLRYFLVLLFALNVKQARSQNAEINIFPDSIINDVSNQPTGINLNFLMDGGRFPNARYSVTKSLQKMGVKYLRYPGGEKSDLYLFSVPPYSTSKPTLARTGGLEDYPGMLADTGFVFDPLDFDEFIAICRSVNAEPVLVVAADRYLAEPKAGEKISTKEELIKHAREWVRYANIKKKYGIKYWMIGNESWNINNVNSTAEIYANDVVQFSKAMKEIDSTILITANANTDDFFRTVIAVAGDHIDRLCVSNYGVERFHRGYKTYQDTTQVLINPTLTAINAMKRYANEAQLKKLKLIVAEYGSIDWAKNWKWTNDIGHAIVTFDMTGQLLLRNEIEFSCFWNTRWIDNEKKPAMDHDALDPNGDLNPTGISLMLWSTNLGSKMVKSSAPNPLVCFSSVRDDTVIVYVINKSDKGTTATFNFQHQGYRFADGSEYFGITPEDTKPLLRKGPRRQKDGFLINSYSINILKFIR